MIHHILKDRPAKLFVIITAFFVANALIAECIGGKIFSLENYLGYRHRNSRFLGRRAFRLTLPAGSCYGRWSL
jgi:hypothetical protein